MNKIDDIEIAVIGAGIVGIATAYYLCKKYQRTSVVLIDARDPMSYTSAQSGDNYRNWWPSELMTQFTNHSISLMRDLAEESSNELQMKQTGYALATRKTEIDDLISALEQTYDKSSGLIRVHQDTSASVYQTPYAKHWDSSIDGVDILSNTALIKKVLPAFSADIENVLHIRRAGDFSSQQMGQYMLQQIAPKGCKRLRGKVCNIVRNGQYQLEIETPSGTEFLKADMVVNAAGPYVGEIANMLGVELPIKNIFHQKLAFEDILSAVPRNQPFSIDIDETVLDWNDDERQALADEAELSWLTKPIEGGIHCRPEGSGKWIKLGWAYNREVSTPDYSRELIEDPMYKPSFPEIVLRGASKLNPGLQPYVETLPTNRVHYGGYYTMTDENWPLIGPLDHSGAFVVGALSGYGCMSACAAGSIAADWVCNKKRPEFADSFGLDRYSDPELIQQMALSRDIGLL